MPGLNDLKAEFDATQLEIIGNPCNNFGLQEPGTNAEIPNAFQYVRPGGGYIPNFVLTQKIEVNGLMEIPLYTYLKDYCPPTKERIADTDGLYYTPVRISDITWNFEKFLVFGNGSVYKRYEPSFPPMDMVDDVNFVLSEMGKVNKKAEQKTEEAKNRPLHRYRPNRRG